MTLKDLQAVGLHPSTCLDHNPEFVIYNEYVMTNKNYIRTVTEISPEWVFDIDTEYFLMKNLPESDAKRKLEKIKFRMTQKAKKIK